MFSNSNNLIKFIKSEWDYILSTPLYINLYGLTRSCPEDLEEFEKLPYFDRKLLADTSLTERCGEWEGSKILVSSNGTTGEPIIFPWTKSDENAARSATKRIHKRVPWNSDDVVFVMAPLGLGSMWRHMQRQVEVAGATLLMPGIQPLNSCIKMMENFGVTIIITLPSLALRLGELLRSCNQQLPNVRQIACGGDLLSKQRRKRIERLWGDVECWNFFGMSELFGPYASECWAHDRLHIDQSVFVEVLPDSNSNDELGLATVTAMWKRAAPIIRYCTDDVITYKTELCSCGEETQSIEIHGKDSQCPFYKDCRILLNRLDDLILANSDLGTEWSLSLSEKTPPQLHLESPDPKAHMRMVQKSVSELLGVEVEVSVYPCLEGIRQQPKPTRILIQESKDQPNIPKST